MSETYTGYLHVVRTRKRPRSSNPFSRYLTMLVEDAMHEKHGTPIPEYAPIYFFHVPGRTVGTERKKRGVAPQKWRTNSPFMFRFKGQPKALDREMEGWKITVRGQVEPFHANARGGHMVGYRVLDVHPPKDGDLCVCKEDNDE